MTQVRLGGYPAKKCARLTHNNFAPTAPTLGPASPEVQALWDAGRVFEADVVDELRSLHDAATLVVLDDSDGWAQNQLRTVAAMRSGLAVIVGGRLPDSNGRIGAPDVLVRHGGGYLPVDIKSHQSIKVGKKSTVEVSPLAAPDQRIGHDGYSNRANSWRDDVMQLSHYTRMLQELGFHPEAGPKIGGIIGTSDLTGALGGRRGVTWYDLDAETIDTYSATASRNRKKRSALQRYDHEFGFRIAIAETALAGGEMVRPYRISDCDSCEWFDYCADVAGPDDASFAVQTGHLDIREWRYLYQRCGRDGALSVTQLAGVDVGAHTDGFRIQSVGNQKPDDRLATVVKRAQMTAAGVDFEPRDPNRPPPQVPSADIEADFDIEWDLEQRIYQWGLRIRDGQDDATARYEPVVSFDDLDEAAELALAETFADRIRGLRAHADREGKSLRIFHWHHPEISRTQRFPAVREALEGLTVDLMSWFNSAYFARTSSSIKDVARVFGYQWGVDDPGGLASTSKIDIARGSDPQAHEARTWCLAYNESDVVAQAVIRDGLRRLTPPAQPCD